MASLGTAVGAFLTDDEKDKIIISKMSVGLFFFPITILYLIYYVIKIVYREISPLKRLLDPGLQEKGPYR